MIDLTSPDPLLAECMDARNTIRDEFALLLRGVQEWEPRPMPDRKEET